MEHLDPKQVLDWMVPSVLLMIAWYLRKLDGSVKVLSASFQSLTTGQAVMEQRMDEAERRLDKLET